MTHVDSIFGPLWTHRSVEEAAANTIEKWIPDYLAWIKQVSDEEVPLPKRYDFSNTLDDFDVDRLPHIILIAPGLAAPPIKDGDGYLRARWTLGIGVVVSANNADNTRLTAALYGAALRNMFLHKSTLDGEVEKVQYEDERYDDIPAVDQRTLGAVRLVYTVEVRDFARTFGGPKVPTNAPDPDQLWPSVETADVEGGTL